jgi:hypothetical protein
MDLLSLLAIKHNTDKNPNAHNFTPIYNNLLKSMINDKFNFLEIGVFYGSSIKMWNDYFNNAIIYGADTFKGKQGNGRYFNNPEYFYNQWQLYKNTIYNRVELIKLDQSSIDELKNFVNYCKSNNIKFKVILDDASHLMRDQQITFYYLFQLLDDNGLFIIEDTHTSDDFGYDLLPDKSNSTNNFIDNILKNKIIDDRYILDYDKEYANNIINSINNIERIKSTKGSETTVIYRI